MSETMSYGINLTLVGLTIVFAVLATIAGLVVVFFICIGWAWAHQLDISCGCHGGDAPIHYWGKVAEFLGYFLMLGWLWWMEKGSAGAPPA